MRDLVLFGPTRNLMLAAAAVVLMARARDFKFNIRACQLCGERGEHAVGCPGRRGN